MLSSVSSDLKSNQTTAYIFGANALLGEAFITQIVASRRYDSVYVLTTQPLPSTIVHLKHCLVSENFVWQTSDATQIDCFFMTQPYPSSSLNPTTQALSRSGLLSDAHLQLMSQGLTLKPNLYSTLYDNDLLPLLKQITQLPVCGTQRWCIVSPHLETAGLNYLNAFATGDTAYGELKTLLTYTGDIHINDTIKTPYAFKTNIPINNNNNLNLNKPTSKGLNYININALLDRFALNLLNLFSKTVHHFLHNRGTTTPLSTAVLAERLFHRFMNTHHNDVIHHLTRDDVLKHYT